MIGSSGVGNCSRVNMRLRAIAQVVSVRFPPKCDKKSRELLRIAIYVQRSPKLRSFSPLHFLFFLNKRPELVQLNPSWGDLLYRMVVESLSMFSEQAIVTGNGVTMTTGHSRNTAHRDLLSGMPTDELNLSSIQSGAIEGVFFVSTK